MSRSLLAFGGAVNPSMDAKLNIHMGGAAHRKVVLDKADRRGFSWS
jgi:hypothetical protein